MARTCIDVPPTSGHAHLKSIHATASYGQGTGGGDVIIVGFVFLGIAIIVLAGAIWARWIS